MVDACADSVLVRERLVVMWKATVGCRGLRLAMVLCNSQLDAFGSVWVSVAVMLLTLKHLSQPEALAEK